MHVEGIACNGVSCVLNGYCLNVRQSTACDLCWEKPTFIGCSMRVLASWQLDARWSPRLNRVKTATLYFHCMAFLHIACEHVIGLVFDE